MRIGSWRVTLLSEDQVSPRRRALTVLFTVLAAVATSWPDLFGDQPRWKGLAILVVLSGAAGITTSAVVGRVQVRREWEQSLIARNLAVLRRTARPIPQRRRPPVLSEFTGRDGELHRWVLEHRRLRGLRRRKGMQQQSPVIMAMHGPPGVGKSALAHKLSRRLAGEYPDGLLVANFGTSGTARSPADIARDLLLQLGWREWEMPDNTLDRVNTLRSLTRNKRILFLFDAVRDHDTVNQVMPSEPGCAVIITSRREIGSSLGLPARPPIRPLSLHDSLEMLSSIAGFHWTRDAETAVEIAELCGHLPLAIRAAAERVRDGQGLRYVAASLRPALARLEALDHAGRSVRERIASEFHRLDALQQRALTLLASLDAESFVPWVLRPLMRLEHGVSTTIVAGLAAAQFVEEDGTDHTGQARYRIHPLMRLYAMSVADEHEVRAAQERFVDAYIELIDDVLAIMDPVHYVPLRTGKRRWRSEGSEIAEKIAGHLDHIIRREYLNLVRMIRVANRPEHRDMVSRVAAMLDGRAPAFPPSARTPQEQIAGIDEAFRDAVTAARELSTPDSTRAIDVQLARAQFLIAVEHYREATRELDKAAKGISDLEPRGISDPEPRGISDPEPARPDEAVALRLRLARVRTWLHLEVGSFHEARTVLGDADSLVHRLTPASSRTPHVQTDIALVQQLNRDVQRVVESSKWKAVRGGPVMSNDIVELHTRLAQAEELRRRGYWDNAASILRDLLGRDGDARGHTSIHYRLATFQVEHAQHLSLTASQDKGSAQRREKVVLEAIQHAAACIVTFGTIGDPVGQIRGRALLARALVLHGNLMAATQLDIEVRGDLASAADDKDAKLYIDALTAQYLLAHADVEFVHGRMESCWESIVEAVQRFRALGDWSSHADAWRLMHLVYDKNPGNLTPIDDSDE